MAVAAGTGAILYLNRSPSGGPTPVQTVTTYNEAINRQDAQTAWDQLSTHYQSQYGSKEAFFRSVAQSSAISDYKLSLTQEDSSTATVVDTYTLSGCPGAQIAYLLVNENGVWKIDALRVAKPCP